MTDVASQGPNPGSLVYSDQNFIGLAPGTSTTVPLGWGILNYTYLTDNQSLILTLGDQGYYDQAATYGYMHCDTGFTVGAYCKITNDQIVLGSFTRSGSTFMYTPFSGGAVGIQITPGTQVEFYNNGTNWTAAALGKSIFSVTNSSVTFSSARRTAAVSMERKNSSVPVGNYPAGDFDSFRVAGITMSDLVTPTYNGSGGKMWLNNTGGTLNGSGGQHVISSYFNTSIQSGDVTTTLSSSKFAVTFGGWYKVILRVPAGSSWAAGVNSQVGTAIFLNGTIYELAYVTSQAITAGDSFMASHIIYLNAGDYIQAGYVLGSSSVTSLFGSGDTNGTVAFFSIALLTRNLH